MFRRLHGFTLIELMVTLAVLAIVLAVAIPSFNTQIQNNRSLALGEDLATALNFARSEAVKRGAPVSLCASNPTGDDCSGDPNSWVNGWLVVVDSSAVTDTSVTASEVLRVWEAPSENAVVSVESAVPGSTAGTATDFVRYTGMGTLARINDVVNIALATAKTSDCSGRHLQTITVGVSGTVNVARNDC